MNNISTSAKVFILSVVALGIALTAWTLSSLDWTNTGLYLVSALGAIAQTLKVEGPDDRTNYSIAWFVYGFALLAFGASAALFVVIVSHLVEWVWHKYSWYIQAFNIGAHLLPLFLAGLVFNALRQGSQALDLNLALALALAAAAFVLGNHLLVGLVVKLARGQSFAESGVLGFFTLFLDFTILSMGAITALVWASHPFASLLNILPLILLYHALRVPKLMHQLAQFRKLSPQSVASPSHS
jgi:hypothetical protein